MVKMVKTEVVELCEKYEVILNDWGWLMFIMFCEIYGAMYDVNLSFQHWFC